MAKAQLLTLAGSQREAKDMGFLSPCALACTGLSWAARALKDSYFSRRLRKQQCHLLRRSTFIPCLGLQLPLVTAGQEYFFAWAASSRAFMLIIERGPPEADAAPQRGAGLDGGPHLHPSARAPDKAGLGQAICPRLTQFFINIINYAHICLYDRKHPGNLEQLTNWIYFSYFYLTIWLCLYKVIIFEYIICMHLKACD